MEEINKIPRHRTGLEMRGALNRLFWMVITLSESPFGLTIAQLEERTGYSYRTIYRDIHRLQDNGFPVVSEKKFFGNKLPNKYYRIQSDAGSGFPDIGGKLAKIESLEGENERLREEVRRLKVDVKNYKRTKEDQHDKLIMYRRLAEANQ